MPRQQAGSRLEVGTKLAVSKQAVSRQKAAGRQQAGGSLEQAADNRLSRGSLAGFRQVIDIRTSAGS